MSAKLQQHYWILHLQLSKWLHIIRIQLYWYEYHNNVHTLDVLLMHLLILTVGKKYRRAILVKHENRMLHIENLPNFSWKDIPQN